MAKVSPLQEALRLQSKISKLKQTLARQGKNPNKGVLTRIAKSEDIPKSSLTRKLKILSLDESVQRLFDENIIMPSFVDILEKQPKHEQYQVAQKIIREGLSVRQLTRKLNKDGQLLDDGKVPHSIEIDRETMRQIDIFEEKYQFVIRHYAYESEASIAIHTWDVTQVKDLMLVPALWASEHRVNLEIPASVNDTNPYRINITHKSGDSMSAIWLLDKLLGQYDRLIQLRKEKRNTLPK